MQGGIQMLKNVYIFRNGQSSHNLAGRLQGQSNDSVLTDQGINQAFSAAKFLKDKNIEVIISSPQRRAKQTGCIVAKQLNTPIQYDSRLAEANLGTADGEKISNMSKKHKQILQDWQNHKPDTRFQNGESPNELQKRVLSALKDYTGTKYKNIAISSHNFSIIEALHGMKAAKKEIANGEIVHLQYDGNNWKYVQSLN